MHGDQRAVREDSCAVAWPSLEFELEASMAAQRQDDSRFNGIFIAKDGSVLRLPLHEA